MDSSGRRDLRGQRFVHFLNLDAFVVSFVADSLSPSLGSKIRSSMGRLPTHARTHRRRLDGVPSRNESHGSFFVSTLALSLNPQLTPPTFISQWLSYILTSLLSSKSNSLPSKPSSRRSNTKPSPSARETEAWKCLDGTKKEVERVLKNKTGGEGVGGLVRWGREKGWCA